MDEWPFIEGRNLGLYSKCKLNDSSNLKESIHASSNLVVESSSPKIS